jgi:hypothetical protein
MKRYSLSTSATMVKVHAKIPSRVMQQVDRLEVMIMIRIVRNVRRRFLLLIITTILVNPYQEGRQLLRLRLRPFLLLQLPEDLIPFRTFPLVVLNKLQQHPQQKQQHQQVISSLTNVRNVSSVIVNLHVPHVVVENSTSRNWRTRYSHLVRKWIRGGCIMHWRVLRSLVG